MDSLSDHMEQRAEEQEARSREAEKSGYEDRELRNPDWNWPTVSRAVSGTFGERENGAYSDHVNIHGAAGDEIYAVADGVVTEAAYKATVGYFIVVDLGDGVTVKYGHLKEIRVAEGEEIEQGQVIATLGQTGRATGPNLRFEVSVDGEAVNPFAE